MFAEVGIEADLSELESATSEADFMAKSEELSARVRRIKQAEMEAAHCGETGHHSTDNEQLRAAEEFRKRSIATIKAACPSFASGSRARRQKQKMELMQELTVAFRENDLHTLLRLEMQWIEKEGGDVERLTEEKLDVYNEFLTRQVEGLEQQLRDLVFRPRYRSILIWENRLARTIDGAEKTRELDENISNIERSVHLLEAATTADDVRAAVGPFWPAAEYPQV